MLQFWCYFNLYVIQMYYQSKRKVLKTYERDRICIKDEHSSRDMVMSPTSL